MYCYSLLDINSSFNSLKIGRSALFPNLNFSYKIQIRLF